MRLKSLINSRLDALSSPAAIAGVYALYGVFHIALRFAFTDAVPIDDALAIDVSQQTWALAYQVRNPPLWEWLIVATQSLFGRGLLPLLVLHYAFAALIALAMRAAVLEATRDYRLAAASAYGMVTFYWFGWQFHVHYTHSLLLILACVVHLLLALKWVKRPSAGLAVGLTMTTALGMLSKWSFLIYLAAIVAAALAAPETRRRLADWRLLVPCAFAAAAVTPVLLVAGELGTIAGTFQSTFVGAEPYLDRVARGLWHLPANLLLLFLPWLILVLIALAGAERPSRPPDPFRAFLNRCAIFAVSILLVGLFAWGVRGFGAKYLFPVCIPIVLAISAYVAAARRADALSALLAPGAAATVVIVVAARLIILAAPSYPETKANRQGEPYAALARSLEEVGLGDSAFVTFEVRESANLISQLPLANAAAIRTPRLFRPMSYQSDRRCVFLWNAGLLDGARPEPRRDLPLPVALRVPEVFCHAPRHLEVPWRSSLVGERRTSVFGVIDLGTNAETCRRHFNGTE